MDDAEQDSLHAVLRSDNTVLVATTIATLFLAGSALICRSGRRLSFSPHSAGLSLSSPTSQADSDAKKHPHKSHGKNAADGGNDDGKDLKNSRSKERRRRGKDPLKEILKGGKKLKMLTVSRDHDTGSSTSASTSPLPQIHGSGFSQRSASVSTSSRSVSSSTVSSAAAAGIAMTDLITRDSENGVVMPASSGQDPNGRAHDANPPPASNSEADHDVRDISEIPEVPLISICSSSSASISTSLTTPTTSPSISPSDKSSSGSTVLHASQPYPEYSQPANEAVNPWDWDGQGPEGTYRKPPRFRSKSRGSPIPPSVSMPYSTSFSSTSSAEPVVYSPQQPSASSSVSSEDFTFPTLNTTTSPTFPPGSSQPIIGSTGNGTPRRVPTPQRTPPTPASGGNTPPPSLNSQTQIASLRGALEAARMREEKAKADLDRYAKDFEMMRWENNTWRRRELELQTQIHHLMHQLQGYAALFASSMSPTGQPHLQVPNGSNSPSGVNGHGPPSPNGYPGMFPPTGMLSPIAVNGQQFFAYPAAPPPPPPNLQPNPFMMFPAPAPSPSTNGGSGSGPSSSVSVSGSSKSSVGSVSPDLVGSPTPFDRGRQRTRTQTAEAQLGTWEGEMAEGWVGIEPQDAGHEGDAEDDEEEDYEEEDGGFSEALADAILKRPESIRVRSKKGGRHRDKSETTEFTFPSISDFGNISGYRERNVVAEQEQDQDPGLGEPNDSSEPVVGES